MPRIASAGATAALVQGFGCLLRKVSAVVQEYGVFDFADLFSEPLMARPIKGLTPEAKKSSFRRFEHKVSDHMPLAMRRPLP